MGYGVWWVVRGVGYGRMGNAVCGVGYGVWGMESGFKSMRFGVLGVGMGYGVWGMGYVMCVSMVG